MPSDYRSLLHITGDSRLLCPPPVCPCSWPHPVLPAGVRLGLVGVVLPLLCLGLVFLSHGRSLLLLWLVLPVLRRLVWSLWFLVYFPRDEVYWASGLRPDRRYVGFLGGVVVTRPLRLVFIPGQGQNELITKIKQAAAK